MASSRYFRAVLDDVSHNNTLQVALLLKAAGLDSVAGTDVPKDVGLSTANEQLLSEYILSRIHDSLGTGSKAVTSLATDVLAVESCKNINTEKNFKPSEDDRFLPCAKLCYFNDNLAGAVIFDPANALLQSRLLSLTMSKGQAGAEPFAIFGNNQITVAGLTTPSALSAQTNSAYALTPKDMLLNTTMTSNLFSEAAVKQVTATTRKLLDIGQRVSVILPIAVLPQYRLSNGVSSSIETDENATELSVLEASVENKLIAHAVESLRKRGELITKVATKEANEKSSKLSNVGDFKFVPLNEQDRSVFYLHSKQGRTAEEAAAIETILTKIHGFAKVSATSESFPKTGSDQEKYLKNALLFLFTYDKTTVKSREAREQARTFSPSLDEPLEEEPEVVVVTKDNNDTKDPQRLPALDREPAGDAEPAVNSILAAVQSGELTLYMTTI